MIIGRSIALSHATINSIIKSKLKAMIAQIFKIEKVIIKALNRKGILSKKDNKEIKKTYKEMLEIRKGILKRAKKRKKSMDSLSKRLKEMKKKTKIQQTNN